MTFFPETLSWVFQNSWWFSFSKVQFKNCIKKWVQSRSMLIISERKILQLTLRFWLYFLTFANAFWIVRNPQVTSYHYNPHRHLSKNQDNLNIFFFFLKIFPSQLVCQSVIPRSNSYFRLAHSTLTSFLLQASNSKFHITSNCHLCFTWKRERKT